MRLCGCRKKEVLGAEGCDFFNYILAIHFFLCNTGAIKGS